MASRKLVIVDVVLFVVGIILIVIGAALFPILEKKIKETVENNVRLVDGTQGFTSWQNPAAPIYISFYFFNVSNAKDVIKNGSKPILKEFGPFTYREYRNKTNIEFVENGDRIRYKEHKYYVFDRELSSHNDSFQICTLNIPVLTVASQVRFYNSILQFLLAEFLSAFKETLIQCLSVKELLWGYLPTTEKEINEFLRRHNISKQLNYTFGIYSGPTANGTDDGEIEIFSGVGDISKLGTVNKWRENSSLPFWHDDCNRINGSDGTIWHPFVDTSERIYIFNTDVCRSIYITYNSTVSISPSAITTYKFTAPPSVMADPHTYPENRCFCSPYDANGTFCLRAGVLNVSTCRQNAPIIMSQPHFFEAPDYVNEVIGLAPDASKHQTVLNIEPWTGITLNASKRIQINMYVENLIGFKDTWNLDHPIVFPISWVDEHAAIPDDEAEKFYHQVILPMKIADGIKYGLLALGGFLLVCAVVLLIVILVRRRREKREELAADGEERASLIGND